MLMRHPISVIFRSFAILASLTTLAAGATLSTHSSTILIVQNKNTRNKIVRELMACYKMNDEKRFDAALAVAYRALKMSRETKDDPLELETMRTIGEIYSEIGNDFLAAKFLRDWMIRLLEEFKTLGMTGYYKKYWSAAIDFLKVDEQYLVYGLRSDRTFTQFVGMLEQLKQALEETEADLSGEEVPAGKRKVFLSFKSSFEKTCETFTESIANKDIPTFKRAFIELFEAIDKFAKTGAKYVDEEDREDYNMVMAYLSQYKNVFKAFIAKDRAKLMAAIEKLFQPIDAAMKRDEGLSFDQVIKTGSGETLAEIEERIERGGEEIVRQVIRSNSQSRGPGLLLLHLTKSEKAIEPTLRRHGYLTFSDLEPYGDQILGAADVAREEAKEKKDDIPMPMILPASHYSVFDNAIAFDSGLSDEGRWLYRGDPALLLSAKEEVAELRSKASLLERRLRVSPGYFQGGLLLRCAATSFDERNYAESLSYLQRALDHIKSRHDRESTWQMYLLMGLVQRAKADVGQAINSLRESIKVIEGIRSSFRSENVRAAVIEDRLVVYEFLIDWLVEAGNNSEALAFVERTKARVLLDRFLDPRMKRFPLAKTPSLETVRSSMEKIEELELGVSKQQSSLEDQTLKSLTERIKTENDRYLLALEELRYSNPEVASIVSGEVIASDDIQKLTDENTVMLEYYIGAQRSLVFAVGRQGNISVAPIAASYEDIEGKIRTFRDLIDQDSDDYVSMARELYRMLIRPVQNRIEGKRLCIIANGPLHFLPFQALMNGDRYLIQDHQIFYSPSASVLKYTFGKKKTGNDKILLIANPAGNLRSAEDEARGVASIFPHAVLLIGPDASKAAVLDAMSDAAILHFATHATLNQETPLLSSLLLARESSLTVADLYNMEIKANLVTLSACETHLGKITTGDDVISLSRAFLFAGASSIVTSLWQVKSDDSTSRLMVSFYRRLTTGNVNKAQALQGAQLQMINSAGSSARPKNWAHFMLIGDYR